MDSELENKYYDSIKSIIELTTRIDERVQVIINKHKETDELIENLEEEVNETKSRVKVLESQADSEELQDLHDSLHEIKMRLTAIEKDNNQHEQRWKVFFNFAMQLVWVVLASYVLYKMGIQSPQLP